MPRATWRSAAVELAARDANLAAVVDQVGPPTTRARDPNGPFGALLRAIVFQQLAGKAAAAIHGRVLALVNGPLTPKVILKLSEEQLRGAGLSNNKYLAVRDLATKVLDGTVELDRLGRLKDERLIEQLVSVRGIGPWTAEMFLMFELQRPDVWPVDDFGVRAGWKRLHHLAEAPKPKELLLLGEPLRPYRSAAAWYCWRAVETVLPD